MGVPLQVTASVADPIKYLPVQDAGRIKPYDTFAREALELVYGKSSYKGKTAVEVVSTWMVIPDLWDKIEIVEVRHSGVREALKLEEKRIHYSPIELLNNIRIPLVMQELRSMREKGEKLNPYFQEVQRLENQLSLYQAIKMGLALRVVPQKEKDQWLAVSELTGPLRENFIQITTDFVKAIAAQNSLPPKSGIQESEDKYLGAMGSKISPSQAQNTLKKAVTDFIESARAIDPLNYGTSLAMKLEVHYNQFHPFMWAWIAYLICAILLYSSGVNKNKLLKKLGWGFLWAAFLLHIYGMGLRVYLAGRPPVSNMYETVVWVPWGCMLFALILNRWLKNQMVLIVAALVAVFCLILTDLSPTVLDDSIQPLEPVLRSTFWLSTHVLIIAISYAAFFLAFALGDWVLYLFLRDEKKYQTQISEGVLAIYRSIQIGVVLLAIGIILGGVWADYSWGRFWGWDPKETWALIALLGYIALLHARLVGWVNKFGLAAWSILSFSLVIMAWYGVNFVLGAGLHSYGFGAGGVEYVTAFVAAHLCFVGFVFTVRNSRLGKSS
ncbi:MAG: cytochrome c biogenesis protein CcsA [Bdellovibrionales bacterium]|nr:cytochrome c biogenesis protein CcsA [Bdellovibrionales bacterium]